MLLRACRDTFEDKDRVTSRELIEALAAREDGPWDQVVG